MGNSLSVPGERTIRTAAGQSVSKLGFLSPLSSRCFRLHVGLLNLCSEATKLSLTLVTFKGL